MCHPARTGFDLWSGGAGRRTARSGTAGRFRAEGGAEGNQPPLASCRRCGRTHRVPDFILTTPRTGKTLAGRGSDAEEWPRATLLHCPSRNDLAAATTLASTARGPAHLAHRDGNLMCNTKIEQTPLVVLHSITRAFHFDHP